MDEYAEPPKKSWTLSLESQMAVIDIALLAALWCLSVGIVNPIGDFPLNDDWAYGLTVKHLLSTGEYYPLGNTTMTLVTNVIWGAVFCLIAGFNFTVLRLSTLVASFLGIVGIYILARELKGSRWLSVCMALAVAFNPIYYALSHGFMTDVLFMALATWAALFLCRSFKSESSAWIIAGTAAALAATFSRQLGLCIPLAFSLTVLLTSGFTMRVAVRAIAPSLICVGALLAFHRWLRISGRIPSLYDFQGLELLHEFADVWGVVGHLAENTFVALAYLGLLLLPVLVISTCALAQFRGSEGKIAVALGMLFMAACVVFRVLHGDPISMPLSHDILIKAGIGPLTLRDLDLERHVPGLPVTLWIAITLLALVGGALLVATVGIVVVEVISRLLRRKALNPVQVTSLFLALCGFIYLSPLLPSPEVIDRYLIPAALFLGLSVVGTASAIPAPYTRRLYPPTVIAYALITAFAMFSIKETRDYLAWNRLRWQALHELTQQDRIPASDIDGGYEFNGLYLYNPQYDFMSHLNDTDKSWWWVQRDTYIVSFGPMPWYSVVKEYTCKNWLPCTEKIVVLRRR